MDLDPPGRLKCVTRRPNAAPRTTQFIARIMFRT